MGLESLSEAERALIGKTVMAVRRIELGSYCIQPGMKGKITDFGRMSGDPCIKWRNGEAGFTPWSDIKILD